MQRRIKKMSKSLDAFQRSANTELMNEQWQLLPYFVLRQTGFPLELLDALSSSDLATASKDLTGEILHMKEVRSQTLAFLRTYQRQRQSSSLEEQVLAKLHSKLEKGVPIPVHHLDAIKAHQDLLVRCLDWNATTQHLHDLKAAYADLYNGQIDQMSLCLIKLFAQRPEMRQVLLISNEANYDLFDEWLKAIGLKIKGQKLSRSDRRKVDTLMMYLQRICTKNDTNSHFGPFSTGQVRDRDVNIDHYRAEKGQRTSFYTHWAASQLAQQMSLDPALIGAIKPRRNPLLFLHAEKQELRYLDLAYNATTEPAIKHDIYFSPPITLTPVETRLIQACDGDKSVTALFSAWQQEYPDVTWEKFIQLLKSLQQRAILHLAFEIPVGSQNTLRDLRKLLPENNQPWSGILEELEELLQQFSQAEDIDVRRRLFTTLKTSFQNITGELPVRGMGQTYADRSVLFEECFLNCDELHIGGLVVKTIERDLSLYYDLLLLAPRYRLNAERQLLSNWFETRFKTTRSVPLEDFLVAFAADASILEPQYLAIDMEVHALMQRIEEAIVTPSSLTQKEIQIDPLKMHALLAKYSSDIPAVCNPDVMISAASYEAIQKGDFQVVVGDCHAAREILSHTSLTSFIEQKFPDFIQDLMHLYRTIIEDDEVVVDIIRTHPEKTAAQATLPCFDIELYGRSPKPRSEVLSLQDITVCQTSKGLRLYASRLQKFIRPLSTGFGPPRNTRNPFNIFGFPRHHSGLVLPGSRFTHIPRISMNRVVIQREIWRVPLHTFTQPVSIGNFHLDNEDASNFLRTKQIQESYQLPRFVFAKISSEPKVVYVDFEAPLLVRQLQRLIKHAEGYVEFSEMFPGPGQFWLTSSQGHHTCELRCAVFSVPGYTNKEENRG